MVGCAVCRSAADEIDIQITSQTQKGRKRFPLVVNVLFFCLVFFSIFFPQDGAVV